MQVTSTLIDHLAQLARLQFNDAEKENIRTDLQRMVNFVEKLQEVNTDGIEPLTHMTGNVDVFRDDESYKTITTEEAMRNASKHTDNYFVVPKVIKK
jgi:aspartyl-tRNA(Asn)/glutamyl-tRNA(Gln) amidotransferase subunit C